MNHQLTSVIKLAKKVQLLSILHCFHFTGQNLDFERGKRGGFNSKVLPTLSHLGLKTK